MKFIKLQNRYKLLIAKLYTWLMRRSFGSVGKGSLVHPSFHSNHPDGIHLGRGCEVFGGGWIDTFCLSQGEPQGEVRIGDGVYIGHRCHINSCKRISLGNNVVIADGVFISDHSHGFEDIHSPIMPQPLVSNGPVIIEDEVWLGERVCVMSGVTIGKHSVVGCNSVVTRDIPAYSVAVGSPARVIRQYNPASFLWETVTNVR